MAQSPRNMTALASPMASALFTPSVAPSKTIAILMYSSGRTASFIRLARLGRKFPTTRPAINATMKPASPVRFIDHGMPNFFSSIGVAAR